MNDDAITIGPHLEPDSLVGALLMMFLLLLVWLEHDATANVVVRPSVFMNRAS